MFAGDRFLIYLKENYFTMAGSIWHPRKTWFSRPSRWEGKLLFSNAWPQIIQEEEIFNNHKLKLTQFDNLFEHKSFVAKVWYICSWWLSIWKGYIKPFTVCAALHLRWERVNPSTMYYDILGKLHCQTQYMFHKP